MTLNGTVLLGVFNFRHQWFLGNILKYICKQEVVVNEIINSLWPVPKNTQLSNEPIEMKSHKINFYKLHKAHAQCRKTCKQVTIGFGLFTF